MTIPYLQIHRMDFHPEIIEYWEILPGVLAPFRASPEAAGLHLHSTTEQRLTKRMICAISIGIGMKMPPGHFGLIKEHSSLALRSICVQGGVTDPELSRRN